jgi:energy-converting hydrogenase Eha subunit F
VLKKAAGQIDDIYNHFYKPAASLEEPALKAMGALEGLESARAVRLAHRQWERQAGTVTAWLAHIAESLRASDGTYTRTDIAVGQTAGQVLVRSALEDY